MQKLPSTKVRNFRRLLETILRECGVTHTRFFELSAQIASNMRRHDLGLVIPPEHDPNIICHASNLLTMHDMMILQDSALVDMENNEREAVRLVAEAVRDFNARWPEQTQVYLPE